MLMMILLTRLAYAVYRDGMLIDEHNINSTIQLSFQYKFQLALYFVVFFVSFSDFMFIFSCRLVISVFLFFPPFVWQAKFGVENFIKSFFSGEFISHLLGDIAFIPSIRVCVCSPTNLLIWINNKHTNHCGGVNLFSLNFFHPCHPLCSILQQFSVAVAGVVVVFVFVFFLVRPCDFLLIYCIRFIFHIGSRAVMCVCVCIKWAINLGGARTPWRSCWLCMCIFHKLNRVNGKSSCDISISENNQKYKKKLKKVEKIAHKYENWRSNGFAQHGECVLRYARTEMLVESFWIH